VALLLVASFAVVILEDRFHPVSAGSATRSALTKQEQPECGLFLAPSTIPGAGLGVFTGEAKRVGDPVGQGDVCIPFLDMYWYVGSVAGLHW